MYTVSISYTRDPVEYYVNGRTFYDQSSAESYATQLNQEEERKRQEEEWRNRNSSGSSSTSGSSGYSGGQTSYGGGSSRPSDDYCKGQLEKGKALYKAKKYKEAVAACIEAANYTTYLTVSAPAWYVAGMCYNKLDDMQKYDCLDRAKRDFKFLADQGNEEANQVLVKGIDYFERTWWVKN
jgi:hypothetical protein